MLAESQNRVWVLSFGGYIGDWMPALSLIFIDRRGSPVTKSVIGEFPELFSGVNVVTV